MKGDISFADDNEGVLEEKKRIEGRTKQNHSCSF
jgi:hypothetical protein